MSEDDRYARTEPDYRFRVVDPGQFHGIGEHEDAFPSVPLLAAYESEDATFLAYWLPWIPQEYIGELATIDLEVSARFREPVLIDLMNGGVYLLETFESLGGKTLLSGLPMADYPFAIAERRMVDLPG